MDDSTFHVIYLLVLGIAFIVPISIKVFKRWKTSESEQKKQHDAKKGNFISSKQKDYENF